MELWDLGVPESPRAMPVGHADTIQSLAFSPTGQLLVTTYRDGKLRLFDPHVGGDDAIRVGKGHGGIKGARVTASTTTGFSRMSDRQVGVWETGVLKNHIRPVCGRRDAFLERQ